MAPPAGNRRQVRRLLEQEDFDAALAEICQLPREQALKHLQAGLAAGQVQIKWRAVTALGQVAAELSKDDPEAAREFLRRLLWCLNEECGAAPWGVAEALGEILAQAPILAPDYAAILLSYIHETGPNFLDWAPLLAGAVWGVGRLAWAQPDLAAEKGARKYLVPLLKHPEAMVRGTAAWALGNLGMGEAAPLLEALQRDSTPLELWEDRALRRAEVAELAGEAIKKISNTNSRS